MNIYEILTYTLSEYTALQDSLSFKPSKCGVSQFTLINLLNHLPQILCAKMLIHVQTAISVNVCLCAGQYIMITYIMLVLNFFFKMIFEAFYTTNAVFVAQKKKILCRGLDKELIVLEYPNNKVCNELEIKLLRLP